MAVGAEAPADFSLEEVLRGRSLVIASNRGPVRFETDAAGELVERRGAGGLVTALSHVMRRASGVWVASAMTPGDREVVGRGPTPYIELAPERNGEQNLLLRYLAFDKETFDRYYNRISNWVFWFMHHGMWNLPVEPFFDERTRDAWNCYRRVNERFAEVVAEEIAQRDQAPVMLHDYHLMLTARFLRKLQPDAFSYHFTHIPWAQPDVMRVLPGSMAREVLDGMLANDLLGFQTVRWARNFMWCCHELLDAEIDMDQGLVRYGDGETVVRHYPISIDIDSVRAVASSKDADRARRWLDRLLGGRKLIIRVDRLELSKNVVRGFRAFEAFLNRYPEWRNKVVHLALLYPSRRALREYREYEATVLDTHDRINAELGTDDWQPIVLLNEDNYTRAIACLSRYDALVVNPIADGMNLVAKEGPAVNETDGVLILSRNAGAWYELAHAAISVNPYDVSDMAEAMHTALTLDPDQRAARARLLREVVERNNPTKWVWHQLRDIRRLHEA